MDEQKLETIESLAKNLRNMAEMTAKYSNNWDNFENICLDMLKAVAKHAAAKEAGG